MATAALYDVGRRLGGPIAGFLAAAFFGANPDFARWHVVILTDSLYASLVALAAWAVHRAAERGGGAYALGAAAVACAALVRPNGWVLVPVAAAYWIAPTRRPAGVKVALAAAVFAAAAAPLVLLAPAMKSVQDVGAYKELRRGTVIWGHDPSRLPMPREAAPDTEGGLAQMAGYALRHPLATTRLASQRLGMEMVHTRTFYSPAHNAAVLVVLLPLYAFAVLGLARVSRHPLALLLLAIIVAHGAIIATTLCRLGRPLSALRPAAGGRPCRRGRGAAPPPPGAPPCLAVGPLCNVLNT
ncbi:MAG TPA: glycosyltransferase family 39 protein [Longimicrobium sp.]